MLETRDDRPVHLSPRRIVKVGGSLFDLPNLGERLAAWLARQPIGQDILLAGGGGFVDALRHYDTAHRLDASAVHWLAIRAMSLSAALLAEILAASSGGMRPPIIADRDALNALSLNCRPAIFDAYAFVQADGFELFRLTEQLPQNWHATSDSIAAYLAQRLSASELVLLKSVLPPAGSDLRAVANAGLIDSSFPQLAAGLSVMRWVNLRQPDMPEIKFLRGLPELRGGD